MGQELAGTSAMLSIAASASRAFTSGFTEESQAAMDLNVFTQRVGCAMS
ncbi:MAG: hypothetical protein ABWX74_19365 [Aeromicrobium sp.]